MLDRIPGSGWVAGAGGDQLAAQGGARAVMHSTEGDSIAGAVAAYRSHGGWPHATWDPRSGEVVQHLHVSQSARALMNLSGGVQTNRYGRVLQLEVVARAARPFTDGPLVGWDRVHQWFAANGVPDIWPMGQPLAYGPDERRPGVSPAAYGFNNGTRSPTIWLTRGGYYAHSQVPENDHGNPGRVDLAKLMGVVPTRPPLDLTMLAEAGVDEPMLDHYALGRNGRGQPYVHYSWITPDGRWHYVTKIDSRLGKAFYDAVTVLRTGMDPESAPQHCILGGGVNDVELAAVEKATGDVIVMRPIAGAWRPDRVRKAA